MSKKHREVLWLWSLPPRMYYMRCLWFLPDIIAERETRQGGSARSAYLEMCIFVSEEPSAGRHHFPISYCRRETATAEALQTPATNRAQKLHSSDNSEACYLRVRMLMYIKYKRANNYPPK
jgi:hypothetical protein